MGRALCKYRGMLVIASFCRSPPGQVGHCPECRGIEFREHAGWIECKDCGFAILKTDYSRMEAAEAASREEPAE